MYVCIKCFSYGNQTSHFQTTLKDQQDEHWSGSWTKSWQTIMHLIIRFLLFSRSLELSRNRSSIFGRWPGGVFNSTHPIGEIRLSQNSKQLSGCLFKKDCGSSKAPGIFVQFFFFVYCVVSQTCQYLSVFFLNKGTRMMCFYLFSQR